MNWALVRDLSWTAGIFFIIQIGVNVSQANVPTEFIQGSMVIAMLVVLGIHIYDRH